MHVFLFILTIIIAILVVNIGALAFEFTGLAWPISWFQALSCFTGTGFTTREAEVIVRSARRRRIASVLMVIGNMGFVALIATFANALTSTSRGFTIPFLNIGLPHWVTPWANLLIIAVMVSLIYIVAVKTRWGEQFMNLIRSHITRHGMFRRVTVNELAVATGGLAVMAVEIVEASQVAGKTLKELDLDQDKIMILAHEHAGKATMNPQPDVALQPGDLILSFGQPDLIKKTFGPTAS